MIAALIYIVALLTANATADLFIHLPVGMMSVGTLCIVVLFPARDVLHRRGRHMVYSVITVALIVSIIQSIWLGVTARIIAASFAAILISESVDTELFAAFHRHSWLTRAVTSNLVSIPLDTVLFSYIAFGGILSSSDMIALCGGRYVSNIYLPED